MYGTAMIGKLASGVSGDDLRKEFETWRDERKVPGFIEGHILISDDGKTIVNVAVFEDKASYTKLADDPEQDRWWSERMAPKIAGDPQWIDGTWAI